jgi:hypothetical protein
VLRSQPDKFTALPVDLQIEILDHLPIYEADKLVREAYHTSSYGGAHRFPVGLRDGSVLFAV